MARRMGRRAGRWAWLAAGLAILGACRAPAPRPAPPTPGPAASGPARAPGAQPPGTPPPQFTFSSWRRAIPLIKAGRVVQTVSGHGGFALVLDDHTWVRLVAEPGDPLPRDPKGFIARTAPNARSIRHTTE